MKILLTILILSLMASCQSDVYGQRELNHSAANDPANDGLDNKLVDIQKSEYAFYFRLIISWQTIEIFSLDKIVFNGTIINSIEEYDEVNIDDRYQTITTRLYSEKIPVDSLSAASVARQIIKSGQPSIPTDTLISNWRRWYLHCDDLNFEIKNDGRYIKQSYHCPWSQPDSAEFKDVILSNYELLNHELKLDSIYDEFWAQLPEGKTYSRDGYRISYKQTDEQLEASNKDKPRRDYLKSVKDTIDNYLNFKLDSLQAGFDSTDYFCYDSYYLTFGKNGKLKKVWIHPYDNTKLREGLSWYIQDRIETRRCYRQIKRIFKKVNLSSFDLEYEVNRTFYFDLGDGWNIIDNTKY